MRERFRREAESAAQLVHPHICSITDFGIVGDQVFLVMPYLARGTLADRINNRRSFPPERTAAIATQVACALDYAHRHGLVHRDIKPDNILFDEDENALVTDFGIATGHFRARMTGTGNVMGTPHYMLPAFVTNDDGSLRELPTICVDSSEFVVSKLKDRGTHQAFGVVTNAQDFMHILRLYVEREITARTTHYT